MMLSSRYLYLHEALGLGPMWLKRGAKVLPAPPAEHSAATLSEPETPPLSVFPATETPRKQEAVAVREHHAPAIRSVPPANSARAAALAAVGSRIGAYEERAQESIPAEKVPADNLPAAHDQAYYLETLAGSISPAKLMVVSICPAPQDKVAGKLFSGSAGQLLDNMLASIGLSPADAHKTSWLALPTYETDPPAATVERALPRMQAERILSRPQALLLLGRFFTAAGRQPLIQSLAGSLPVFYIHHPAQLLRQPQLKADAWAELKRLRDTLK